MAEASMTEASMAAAGAPDAAIAANGMPSTTAASSGKGYGGSGAAGAASGATQSKLEQLKADSGHLLEPLLGELANERPNFSENAVQILKFHGSYQQDDRDNRQKGQDKDWQMMLRLRSPGGCIPAQLYLAIDELADRLGNGTCGPPPARPSRCTACARKTSRR